MPTGYWISLAFFLGVRVSILVLLDDAYRRWAKEKRWATLLGFQSLFFWMMPTGAGASATRVSSIPFQSLFFWMMPTGGDYTDNNYWQCNRFQSLFFWMMPTGMKIASGRIHEKSVSILVLLDDAYRPEDVSTSSVYSTVSILVLLDDAYRPSDVVRLVNGMPSFNPCSSGWCLPAALRSRGLTMLPCFNPCSSGWCLPAPLFLNGLEIPKLRTI